MFEKWKDVGESYMHHQMMNGGRSFVCQLWKAYPDQWTRNKLLGGNLIEAFWNNLCEDPPPPKFPPFEGGQCPVVYDIFYREGDIPGQEPSLNAGRNVTSARLQGPLTEVSVRETDFIAYLTVMNYAGVERKAEGGHRGSAYIRKVFVVRADNQPDTCGNPPPVYPTTQAPQPGQETYDAPITNNDGTDFTVPLGWFDVDFNLPVTINVGPPQLDFTIEINVDGVNLDFGPEPEMPDGTPKPIGPGGENKDFNDSLDDFADDINDNINDIGDKIDDVGGLPSIDLNDYDGTEIPEDEDEPIEDPEINFVRIDVLEVPKKYKTIVLPNPADNTFFAGYFSWLVEDMRDVEIPIRKKQNVFVKPSWSTGFRAYPVNGAKLKITTFKKKLTPPVN